MYGSTMSGGSVDGGSPSKTGQSSSHCLSVMKRRMVRARSMDARALPTVPFLSVSPRSDSHPGDMRPALLTPRFSCSNTSADLLEATFDVNRPAALSPLQPALSSGNLTSPGTVSPIGAIQPDLYKKKRMMFVKSSKDNQEGKKGGRLHFNLKYDFDRSDLIVHIIDVLDSDDERFNDPFVQLSLDPPVDNKERRTDTHKGGSFNEDFKFPVPYEELPEESLLLEVIDGDKSSTVVGRVKVAMAEVDVTSELEIWGEIHKVENKPSDLPEIFLSLSYLPSAGRLTVTVLQASHLSSPTVKELSGASKSPTVKELPDPMVKVTLSCGIKKQKKKKTSVKKSTATPAWNEALSFDVTEEDLKQGHLVVSVLNGHHGNAAILGTCVLGHHAAEDERITDRGLRHWSDMINNPRKAVSMWHVLKV